MEMIIWWEIYRKPDRIIVIDLNSKEKSHYKASNVYVVQNREKRIELNSELVTKKNDWLDKNSNKSHVMVIK